MHKLVRIALLPLPLLMIGCPIYTGDSDYPVYLPPDGGGSPDGGPSGECVGDLDCAFGQICNAGECGEPCAWEGDCDLGEYCGPGLGSRHVCLPGCSDASDCSPGWSCEANTCTPPPANCVAHGDCAAGQQC